MKVSKILLTALILAVAAVVMAVAKGHVAPPTKKVTHDLNHLKGDPKSKVEIIEYTDFQCPACAKASGVVDEELKKYGNKVHFEMKYFPLPMHKNARRAAAFAECASEQGKFWPMHDVLFKTQTSWGTLGSPDEYLTGLAASLGMDGKRLEFCLKNPLTEGHILRNMEEGKDIGISATPSFVVNGKMAVGGENFRKLLTEVVEGHVH
ncbi:MAG: thioredoxin domain-containing protein [Candidatus Omnitrophica bacterium]|nr:thioredoxin domain-containing protein [Candidatus Omnitrophota bacterium]